MKYYVRAIAYSIMAPNGANHRLKRFYSQTSKNSDIFNFKNSNIFKFEEKKKPIFRKSDYALTISGKIISTLTNDTNYCVNGIITLVSDHAKLIKEIKELQLLLGRKPYWNWSDLMSFSFLAKYFIQNCTLQTCWVILILVNNLVFLYFQLRNSGLIV